MFIRFGEEANLYIEKNKHISKSVWIQTRNEYLSRLEKQLSEYFRGQRDKFDLTLDIRGTSFQSRIWDMIIQIPFGETRFYNELAAETGDVKKTRAIANVIAQNNILLVIPCHRVIGIGNKLTGYRGGTERKRWLLEFERTRSQPNQNLLF